MLFFLVLGRYSSSFESLISITNFSALPAPAARQRPVIGFKQMSPGGDYNGINGMSPRGRNCQETWVNLTFVRDFESLNGKQQNQ